MSRNIWQQKSDEELIAASEHLSDYTREAEEIIRAELQRRQMPEPPPTVREGIVDDGTRLNRVKGALRGLVIAVVVIAVINLVDALLIEESIRRGSRTKEFLSWTTELIIVALAAAVGAFIGAVDKPKQIASDEQGWSTDHREEHRIQMWICTNCGKENQSNRNHCWNCSAQRDEKTVMHDRPPSPSKTHEVTPLTDQTPEAPEIIP
jgi:hypothetical protein